MTKDKLADLIAAQDDSEPEYDEEIYDLAGDDSTKDFFNEVQNIQEKLNRIEGSVEEVKQLHSALLTAPTKDSKNVQRLEDLHAEIKQNTKSVRFKLTEIIPKENADSSSAETRMRKTQHMTLSNKLVELMSEYNRAQVDYSERNKANLIRQLELVGKITTPEEINEMIEKGNVSIFTQDILTDTKQAKQQLADIEDRHADLVKLEKSIKELHDMFLDMAMMIETQGDLMDVIEKNVDLTRNFTEEATKDLNSANRFKNDARKKKLMIIVCLALVIIVVVSTTAGFFFK